MFKKRSKKGLSQVDWAISLGIFLLYLAWFFIFIQPSFAPSGNIDVLLDTLHGSVMDELGLEVDRVPIYIQSDIHNEREPVIVPFDFDWDVDDISNTADYFDIDEGKLFFIANLSDSLHYSMFHPHDALTFTPPPMVLADPDRVLYDTFRADFADSMLQTVDFRDEERLRDFSIEVDDTAWSGSSEFSNGTLFAKYKVSDGSLNLSTYAFAENSRLYSFMTPDTRNYSVRMEFTTYNYSYYYLSPSLSGEIRYRIATSCRAYDYDFIDLYDADSGLLVMFSEPVLIRLCSNQTNPELRFEFELTDEIEFDMFFHEGPASAVAEYPLDVEVGIVETLDTVSSDSIARLRNSDYSYLKQIFNYPADRDFNITVSSDSISASYGARQPDTQDIYARNVEAYMLDRDFNQERVLITMTVW